MVGKILGIGAAALTQIGSFVIVVIGAVLLQAPLRTLLLGNAEGGLSLDVASVAIVPLLLLLLYFLPGFLLYASLFAGVGALVRRQDEAQNAVSPITLFFTAGYLVSFIAIYVPEAAWVKVMSHIPFWTPVLMVARAGVSPVAWWEIVISVGVMIATTVICTLLAARLYRFGVLMYGQKPGLGSMVKLLRKQ
jgi:ABC-2 type transport system permease protein